MSVCHQLFPAAPAAGGDNQTRLGAHNQTWAWRWQPDMGLEVTTRHGLEVTTRHRLGAHNQRRTWSSQPDMDLELTTRHELGGDN